jgi:putative ABC transport system ATP-binding protein
MRKLPDLGLLSSRRNKSNGRSQFKSQHLVELRQVVKIYESAASRYAALRGINLTVNPGEFVAVVGKSGSGKSTLMNMVTGIDRPTSGEVMVNGSAIHTFSEGKMAVWRGNQVGVVFQFFQLLPTLTVIENVMLPMDFCRKYSLRERRQRAIYLLEQVELSDQASKLPATLSGGQQQRVAIARALANDPPIVVADEPTGNLDTKTAQSVFLLFDWLVSQGKTIIMVSHDLDLVARVPRVIYLQDGRVVGDGKAVRRHDGMLEDDEAGGALGVDQSEPVEATPDPTDVYSQNVAKILNDPEHSAELLRQEFENIPQDPAERRQAYQSIFDEVARQAAAAEESGDRELARRMWKALAEASGYNKEE